MKYCCEVEPENVPDLVAVTRCKNCKKRHTEDCIKEMIGDVNVTDDWFCADGEPKK